MPTIGKKLFFIAIFLFFFITECFASYFSGISFIHSTSGGKVKYTIAASVGVPTDNYRGFVKVLYKKFEDSDDNYQVLHEIYKGKIEKKSSYPYDKYFFIFETFTDTFSPGKYKIKIEIWSQNKNGENWSEPVHSSYYDKEIIVNSDLVEGSFYDKPLILSGDTYKIGYAIYAYKGISVSNAKLTGSSAIYVSSYANISEAEFGGVGITEIEDTLENFIIKDSIFNNTYVIIDAKNTEIKNCKFDNAKVTLKGESYNKILIDNNENLYLTNDYYMGKKSGGTIAIKGNDNLTAYLLLGDSVNSTLIVENNNINGFYLYFHKSSTLSMEKYKGAIADKKNCFTI